MAEFAQLRKEKWAEPLNQLVALDLLNHNEFKTIILKVDDYEYKIQSQGRKLEDILEYIQFECNLLMTIQDRRKYLGQYDHSDNIDRFIYNEIRSQFGSAEITFTHNIDFWNAKLKFVAMIVPDQDKENEFALLFKKALSYCGRANLAIYKSCVEYLWTFARKPPLDATTARGKKRLNTRRNLSTLMNNIRRITTEAVRNFPENSEASIWVLTTELLYLSILREELDFADENPKVYIPYSIQDEIDKSSKLITVIYDDLVSKNSQNPKAYIQLFESIRMMPLPEARQLAKKTYANIVSIRKRTPEIFAWLIGRSIDDNKVDEFLERINQALCLSTFPKVKLLEMCLEKIECFLEKILGLRDPDNCLSSLLQFYSKLLHKDNPEWNVVPSEALQMSRICFIKRLPSLLERLSDSPQDENLISTLQSFQSDHPQHETVLQFVKIFPSSYVLVKERILHILDTKTGDDLKPLVIIKYLQGVNWDYCDDRERANFLKFLYFAFLTSPQLSKTKYLENFLKMSIPGKEIMNEIKVLHLRKLYIEDVESGREFYERFRKFSTIHWGFACEAVRIESVACRGGGEYSKTLKLALEDCMASAGSSTTEPWKVCYMCHMELGREREASDLMSRALQNFSKSRSDHEDLTLFSNRFSSN